MRSEVLATARYGMGEVTHTEIDALGLGEARRLVFERALDDFARKYECIPDHIVVDGTLYRPWRNVPYTLEPRADDTYPCVSAASVLAKTTRDRQVLDLCDKRHVNIFLHRIQHPHFTFSMCLFEHMSETTGLHVQERRQHKYDRTCAQCGVVLTETTRVAAHVRARPCAFPCAIETLRTTCKACNHVHSKTPRAFWGFRRRLVRLSSSHTPAAP